MKENEIRIFNCDLNDTNLFNCILDELGEKDLNSLSITASKVQDKTYFNCINASLVTCLRKNREELDFPQVQLQTIRSESGYWLVKQINIIVDRQIDDALVYERINQCLKFVKRGCSIDDSIQLSVIHSEVKEDLKHYKVKLLEINQILEEIKDDKTKKEKLFSLFRNQASNE